MKQIEITDSSKQEIMIAVEDFTLKLILRFLPMVQSWQMTVIRDDVTIITNRKLSLGNFILKTKNEPFLFIVADLSNSNIDPLKIDDFSSNRCQLLLTNREETLEVTSVEVR